MIRFGSLFAGIGGLDLGLERAGMSCAWQVENDPYAAAVLRKHWPDVRRWDDVRTFPPAGDWTVDLICGGFPCQPVSLAGKRKAQADERWLWPEFARIIRTLRPRYALMENVPGLLVRGFGDVLGDLAACGYDCEWTSIPAAAVGAPHRRQRLFIVAHAVCEQAHVQLFKSAGPKKRGRFSVGTRKEAARLQNWPTGHDDTSRLVEILWRARESRLRGMVDGIPRRVDRLRCLGNAVVPQVAEVVGRMIVEMDES